MVPASLSLFHPWLLWLSLQVTQSGVSPLYIHIDIISMMSPSKARIRRHYSSPKFGLSLAMATSEPGDGRRGSVTSSNMACSLTRSVEQRDVTSVLIGIHDDFANCKKFLHCTNSWHPFLSAEPHIIIAKMCRANVTLSQHSYKHFCLSRSPKMRIKPLHKQRGLLMLVYSSRENWKRTHTRK